MANKTFVKEVRLKLDFSGLCGKEIFLKTSVNGELMSLKGLTGLTQRAPNSLVFRARFLHNLHGQP